jgi:translation initiation factor IF-2
MGKRVFEIAKELGVDHKDLLARCDRLQISVKNYMSELSDSDVSRLRSALEAEKGGAASEERVQAPGVVRRRRRRGGGDEETNRPPVLKPGAARPARLTKPSLGAARPTPRPLVAQQAPLEEGAPDDGAPAAASDAPAPEEAQGTAAEQPAAVAPDAASAEGTAASEATPAPSAEGEAPAADAPQPPPAQAPGGARILGRISPEALKSRTQRPTRPGPGRSTRRPMGGGPGGPPRGPAPGGAGGPMPTMPAPDRAGDRRRRPAGAAPAGRADADRNKRPGTRRRQVLNREDLYSSNARGGRGRRRKMPARKGGAKTQLTTPAAHKRVVRVDGTISVGELGKELGVKASELIRKLMQMGMMVTLNEQLDLETAGVLATDYDYEVKDVAFDEDEVLSTAASDEELVEDPDAEPRAPVVTIMGHVDHGKTTLLDYIRKAKVAEGEAGGITQHIGAYKVAVNDGSVVFLDTPGHAAFTAMRARGAEVTDLVVLVVAADDGPKPQTEEAINHARAADVPIVVALTKSDKPDSDPERVKQELSRFELVPEEWGGDTMFVPVSGLTGEGVDQLLEALALQAEILELKANPKKEAFGHVVEARLDKGRGPVATILVTEGTLERGNYIVAGPYYGRLRAMLDEYGKPMQVAGPATPVEVLGLNGVPGAGDTFHIVKNERDAKKVVETREDREREAKAKAAQGSAAADLLAMMGKPDKQALTVVLKADVQGSLEAVTQALEAIGNDEVEVKILHSGVGAISESDVQLASASSAVVVGFNVGPDGKSRRLADQEDVTIRKHSVIYDLIDEVKRLAGGLLAPEVVETEMGKAEVKQVFRISKVGLVAGCLVQEGKVLRNALARVYRDKEQVHEGKVATLKRFKDDVREVTHGYECGIGVDGFDDVQEGDVIQVFEVKEVVRELG